jgi:hypothetical protein
MAFLPNDLKQLFLIMNMHEIVTPGRKATFLILNMHEIFAPERKATFSCHEYA